MTKRQIPFRHFVSVRIFSCFSLLTRGTVRRNWRGTYRKVFDNSYKTSNNRYNRTQNKFPEAFFLEFCIILLQYGLVAFKIYSEAAVLGLSLTLFLGVDLPSLLYSSLSFSLILGMKYYRYLHGSGCCC